MLAEMITSLLIERHLLTLNFLIDDKSQVNEILVYLDVLNYSKD